VTATEKPFRKLRLHPRRGNNEYARKVRFAELCKERSIELVSILASATDSWTEIKNARRCSLIDKGLHSTLSSSDQADLSRLQQEAEEYFDLVAPPPIAGALRLHEELLKRKSSSCE